MRVAVFSDESGLPLLLEEMGSVVGLVVTDRERQVPDELIRGVRHLRQGLDEQGAHNEIVEQIADADIDAVLVFSYSRKVPIAELRRHLRFEGVNIHGGLLPECRGANVLNWVLIEGHTMTGVTTHRLTTEIDAGEIAFRTGIPINRTDDALTLRDKLFEVARVHVRRVLECWNSGKDLHFTPQDESLARRFRRRRPADGRIDWSMSDEQIYNLIRGLVAPWPGAFIELGNGERVTLRRLHTMREVQELRARLGGQ